MMLPRPSDAMHRAQLYRLLSEILDNSLLAQNLMFKGGTCATMLDYLDRFSVDLDFDLNSSCERLEIRNQLLPIFERLNLTIHNESQTTLQFFLKYPAKPNERSTLKLEIISTNLQSNIYEKKFLSEIDRYANCQTIETMFANKLVAIVDRFEKHASIASRDLYDIHHFFVNGYKYNDNVIIERRKCTTKEYMSELYEFINSKITDRIILQDLNPLLPYERFKLLRKVIKTETLGFIEREIIKFTYRHA